MLKLSLPRLAVLGALLGTALFVSTAALAQAPPPVPALPDTERRTAYSLTAQTGPFSVGFALYGDSTDYGTWLQVWLCTSAILNPCAPLQPTTDWTLSSATGPLATIPRPITDATITLTSAKTGTLQLVGARLPRRTSQFAENRGVAARDLNQVITDLVAQNRETFDFAQRRTIRSQPGETILAMQPATTRAGGILCWDSTGLIPLTCAAGSSGTANVVGPNVSVVGHIATFGNTSGTILLDGGLVGAGDFVGPAGAATDHVVTFASATGKVGKDSGLTLTPSTGTITLTNAKTLAVTNSLTLSGTDATTMTFPTTSATLARTDAANIFTGHQTIEGVITTGATGTGKLVFDTAPVLGAITVTSVNKMAVTAPATSSTLAVADGKTATHSATTTFAGVDGKTLTINNSGTIAGGDTFTLAIASAKTLTANSTLTLTGVDAKTLTVNNSGTLAGGDAFTLAIAAAKTLTVSNSLTFTGTDGTSFAFPATSDTVATIAAVQTLTNKVLTAPTINGGTAQALTNLGIRSTGSGAFDLTLANSENLTAGRTLTLTVNNAPRTINLSGNITTGADFITNGANSLTLTTTGGTNVTLPISGTLATRDTANTFSATNTFSALQQFTDIKLSSGKIYPTVDSATALQVTKADGTTRVMAFDTSNARVGINKTPGAFDLDVNGDANIGGALTFGTGTITGLTVNNSPSASNDYMLYYNAAAGGIRRCTVGSCAAAATAGVASINGLTGALTAAAGTGLTVSSVGSTVTYALKTLSIGVQAFTGGGTYTPSTGTLFAVAECRGNGGGGGSATGTAVQHYAAGGGGQGSYSRKYISAPAVTSITFGATGTGGAAGSNNGTAGGDVTLTGLCVGKGGSGGLFASAAQIPKGGAGGVAGTGDFVQGGQPGGPGIYAATNTVFQASGSGGGDGGGVGVWAAASATAGAAGTNFGAGGSGASAANTASNAAGGDGSLGYVLITEWKLN